MNQKFPISEEISEEGGATALFVNKMTVALDGAIDDAIAGNYCLGNKALVRNLFFGLMQSIADNITKDGRPRQIGDFITIYPVPTGEIDLEKGWDREKNGIKVRARLLNEMKVNTKDWSFIDVTPGKRGFTLQSVKAGEELGVYDVSKLGEVNGKNLPSTEAGEPLEVHWEVEGTDKSGDIAADKLTSNVGRIDIEAGAITGLTEDDDGKTLALTLRGNFSSGKITAKVKYAAPLKRITIGSANVTSDGDVTLNGCSNMDGLLGYEVEEGGMLMIPAKVTVDGGSPSDVYLRSETGSMWTGTISPQDSGKPFVVTVETDPAKTDFVQETVTKEGSVS